MLKRADISPLRQKLKFLVKKQMCEFLHLMCFCSPRLLSTQTLDEKIEENFYQLKGRGTL